MQFSQIKVGTEKQNHMKTHRMKMQGSMPLSQHPSAGGRQIIQVL